MRNRVWIIILLVVWLGQWEIGGSETSTGPMLTGQTEQFSVASLDKGDREVGLFELLCGSGKNNTILV